MLTEKDSKARRGDPPIIAAYRKIHISARRGFGANLSPEFVAAIAADQATEQCVLTYDEESRQPVSAPEPTEQKDLA